MCDETAVTSPSPLTKTQWWIGTHWLATNWTQSFPARESLVSSTGPASMFDTATTP